MGADIDGMGSLPVIPNQSAVFEDVVCPLYTLPSAACWLLERKQKLVSEDAVLHTREALPHRGVWTLENRI
jgi:hypothetical protein